MTALLRPAVAGGAALIVLGAVLFARAAGLLPAGVAVGPVVLIGLGTLLLIAATRGAGARRLPLPDVATSVPLRGATSARLVLNHGAGTLVLHDDRQEGQLVEGMASGPVDVRATRVGDRLDVTLQPVATWERWAAGRPIAWDLGVTRDVPVDLEVRTGASQVRLDLAEVRVASLRLQTGASDVEVVVPAHGRTRTVITAGAANIRVHVPAGVAASIRNRSALAGFAVDEQRFPRSSDGFASPDFATASDRVEIEVDGGLAAFAVH